MNISIFKTICQFLFLSVYLGIATDVAAQSAYPSKPIKMIIPAAAGGGSDALGRLLATELQKQLGQPVVMEYHGGASGQIAGNMVATAAADGYTLLMTYAGLLTVNPAIFKSLKYDSVKDFKAIVPFTEVPNVLVINPNVPAKNLTELITIIKNSPGKLSYASSGNGTSIFLAMELLRQRVGLDLVHAIYKGGAPAMTDVMGGHVQMMFNNLVEVAPMAIAGKVRPIAIGSKKRSALLPDVPTFAESGLSNYQSTLWYGLVGPAGMPDAVVNKLNAAVRTILQQPEVKSKLLAMGGETMDMSPAEFGALIVNDIELWKGVIQKAGITPTSLN